METIGQDLRISFLPLFLLALPLLEIAGFVIVGREVGALATVGLVLASGIAGVLLLRHQGFGVMARVRFSRKRLAEWTAIDETALIILK